MVEEEGTVQPQAEQAAPGQAQEKKGNGFGIAGFVLGLCSVILFWIWFLGGIFAVTGLIFSIIQLKRHKTGLAIAGLVLSIIGILLPLILIVLVTIMWTSVIPQISSQLDEGTICLDAVSQIVIVDDGTTCVTEAGELNLKVTRGSMDIELSGIEIVLARGGTFLELIESNIPAPNEEKIFYLSGVDYSNIEQISLASVIGTGSNKKTCDRSLAFTLIRC